MKLIAKWFISALSLLAADYFIEGIHIEGGFYIALVIALFLGLINAVIRPILVVLTLPVTVVTLGLFVFVINGILFWFLSTFIKGFTVEGLLPAIVGAVVVSVFSWMGNKLIVGDSQSAVTHVRTYHE